MLLVLLQHNKLQDITYCLHLQLKLSYVCMYSGTSFNLSRHIETNSNVINRELPLIQRVSKQIWQGKCPVSSLWISCLDSFSLYVHIYSGSHLMSYLLIEYPVYYHAKP